ncbi:MAG: ferritin [Methanobacteriota archaeon]
MALSKKMEAALNEQVNAELYSAYLYLSMDSYFESINLKGMAAWMNSQAKEELFHAMKIYNFVHDRSGRTALPAIKEPKKAWKSPLNAFQEAYAHEVMVTGLINDLVDLATKEKDHATFNFLQWYVKEQIEEEQQTDDAVKKLRMIGKDPNGLFTLDQQLGARVPIFNFPAPSPDAQAAGP